MMLSELHQLSKLNNVVITNHENIFTVIFFCEISFHYFILFILFFHFISFLNLTHQFE